MAGTLVLVGLLLKVCHGLPVPLPQYYPTTLFALPPQLLQPAVALTQLVSQLISYKLQLVTKQLYGMTPAPAGNITGQCPSQGYPFVSTLITSLAGHSNTIPQVNIPGAPASQNPPASPTYYSTAPQEYGNYLGASEYGNAQPVGNPDPVVISSQPPSDPQSGLPPQAAPPPQVEPQPPFSGTPPGSQSTSYQNPYDFQNQQTGNAPGGVNPMSGVVSPSWTGNILVQSPSQGPNPVATPEGTLQFSPLPGSQLQVPNTPAGSQSPGGVSPMAGSPPPGSVGSISVQPPPEGASQPNSFPGSGFINPIPSPQLPVSPNTQFQPISGPSSPISNPSPNINFAPLPSNKGLDVY